MGVPGSRMDATRFTYIGRHYAGAHLAGAESSRSLGGLQPPIETKEDLRVGHERRRCGLRGHGSHQGHVSSVPRLRQCPPPEARP